MIMSKRDKRRYIQIATTLGYSAKLIERLEKATTIAEANRIMRKGRETL